jgi:hypothetical protein
MPSERPSLIAGLCLAAVFVCGCAGAAAAVPLSVRVVSVTSPVVRGTDGHLVVQTVPRSLCGLSVQSPSAPGRTLASLPERPADAAGLVSFTVRVPGVAKPGPYPVTVTCRSGPQAVATHFRVMVQ